MLSGKISRIYFHVNLTTTFNLQTNMVFLFETSYRKQNLFYKAKMLMQSDAVNRASFLLT